MSGREWFPPRAGLYVVGLSSVIGALDVLWAATGHAPRLERLGVAATSILLTSLVSSIVIGAAWALVRRQSRDRDAQTLAVGFAVSVCAVGFITVSFNAMLAGGASAASALQWFFSAALAVGLGWAVHRLAALGKMSRVPFDVAPLLPALLIQVAAYAWAQRYIVSLNDSLRNIAFPVFLVVAGGTVLLALSPEYSRMRAGALTASLGAVVLTAALSGFDLGLDGPPPTAERPSVIGSSPGRPVILITIDTLRADAVNDLATPNIDRLRRDGARFSRAFAHSSWTLPSLSTLITGLPPTVHGATSKTARLPDAVVTLAERFHDAGYRTAAFGSNPYLSPKHNLWQGFDEYDINPKTPALDDTLAARIIAAVFARGSRSWIESSEITDRAIDWLDRSANKPFFLWVHYLDPHSPYTPNETFLPEGGKESSIGPSFWQPWEVRSGDMILSQADREWIRKLYDAEVRYVDSEVGRLLDAVNQVGLYDNALIVLTSDHGEEFWEHGGYEHGHSMHEELLHVPLIIKDPNGPRDETVEDVIGLMEVADKITGAAGLERLHSCGPDGAPAPARPIVARGCLYFSDQEAVIDGGYKLIRDLTTGHEQLYDLDDDPLEHHPLEAAGTIRDELAQALQSYEAAAVEERACLNLGDDSRKVNLDRDDQNNLRSLGYVQ